eukprot:s706_g9.t1
MVHTSTADNQLDPTAELTQVAQFREAVLSHLRGSEEQALPLTMLGNLEEVQNLRKGLGGLRKALQRHLWDVWHALEEIELLEAEMLGNCWGLIRSFWLRVPTSLERVPERPAAGKSFGDFCLTCGWLGC